METHVSVAAADEPAGLVGDRMVRHKIGCLPVVDGERRLAGIVTADDFVHWATVHMQTSQERVRLSA
jgi:CBS domain-containing protein